MNGMKCESYDILCERASYDRGAYLKLFQVYSLSLSLSFLLLFLTRITFSHFPLFSLSPRTQMPSACSKSLISLAPVCKGDSVFCVTIVWCGLHLRWLDSTGVLAVHQSVLYSLTDRVLFQQIL